MKRAICILLLVTLYFPFSAFSANLSDSDPAITPLLAASATVNAKQAAQALYDLGLFGGVGTDANGNPIFDLERTPTRQEAITMLVRLLGKDSEAIAGNWKIPFTDVSAWAVPYVGYAYANKLSSGVSPVLYGGNQPVTASQYLAFVLQALGYTSGKDFQWNAAWELSDKIGLTNKQYNAATKQFTRGDIAIISYQALDCKLKGKNSTLRNNFSNQVKPTEHKAPLSTKKEIMQNTAAAYQASARGFRACADALLLLTQKTDTPSLIVSSAKQCQQEFGESVNLLSTAIALCSDYEDAQHVKNGLINIQKEFNGFVSYALSDEPENVLNYLLMVSDSSASSNLIEIQTEIDQWVNNA